MTNWRITAAQGVALQQILAAAGATDVRAANLFTSLVDAIEYQARNSPLDEEDEEFEYCECGRPWNECASREFEDDDPKAVCMDREDYLRSGKPKWMTEEMYESVGGKLHE